MHHEYPVQNEAAQTVSPGRGRERGRRQGETFSLASATMARNSLLGLKTGTGRAATSTGSPVRGFRAIRVLRWRILNVPNPLISMLCCSDNADFTASRNESTTRAQSFLEIRGPAVRAICAVTFSTRSAFVIRPPCRAQRNQIGGQHTGLPIDCQELGGTGGSGPGRRAVPERPPGGIGRRKSGTRGVSPLRRCRH